MRIGVDLGGTKIEAAALGDDGTISVRHRITTPRDDYEATVDAVALLVERLERETGPAGSVGIGTPGAISPATGLIKNANSTWLIDRPLKRDLERRLGRAVRVANDANCFALSEAVDGAGRDARVVFGVILGTGVGGGIVVNREVLVGLNAVAGEWGHNPLPWPGPGELPGAGCYCGLTGCIETYLSGPGLARDHRGATGVDVSAVELVALAREGDPDAEVTLRRYESRLARALASMVNSLDPDVIVLGGGLSNLDRLYTNVPRLWDRWIFSDRADTRLLPPVHGDTSGVRGAAWL